MKASCRLALIAAAELLALNTVQSASSADLGASPPLPPVSHYSWTGFYLGVNGGGARANETFSGTPARLSTGLRHQYPKLNR
jgi:hypothetical protein